MGQISKFQTGHELAIRDHCGVGGGTRTGAKCALQLGPDQKLRTKKEKIPLSKHPSTQLCNNYSNKMSIKICHNSCPYREKITILNTILWNLEY